jgi:3-oxoacyl-(acyl-carrier-protein) synthase
VGFVNAHGTGTLDNDLVEGKVLAEIFGSNLKMLSTKGYTGHTLGAAGGLEAVFTAAGLREGWVPASAGFRNRDEAIPLAPVREKTAVTGRYAVSTSLAFGGNNAAIVIGRVMGA